MMELLRWSKKVQDNVQLDEIRKRGQDEVIMLRRMMERAARTGDLSGVIEYQLPDKNSVTEQSYVNEAVSELDAKLGKLLG